MADPLVNPPVVTADPEVQAQADRLLALGLSQQALRENPETVQTPAPTLQEQLANLRAAQIAANGGIDPNPVDPAIAEQLARISASREQINYSTPPTPTGPLPVFTQDQINRSTEVTTANPETVTDADAAVKALDEQSRQEAEQRLNEAYAQDGTTNIAGSVDQVRSTGVAQTQRNARQQEDWRIRLQLAPQSTYLYNDPAIKQGDLLYPLKATNGVVFPYSPQISTSYKANYDPSDIAHSNYKQYFYKNSSVDDIQILADFTAQDTTEALYVLAVIHFFKSVTKMFYGQDANPRAGTPPPLCYLFGYGQYQFSDHPLLITGFQYSLPNDVDYIRAGSTTQWAGQNVSAYSAKSGVSNSVIDRLFSSGLTVGGITPEPKFNGLSNSQATYVPTKLQITLNAIPIVTRGNIANEFSVQKYATGELLKKGIW
jgi:hypothetical protein